MEGEWVDKDSISEEAPHLEIRFVGNSALSRLLNCAICAYFVFCGRHNGVCPDLVILKVDFSLNSLWICRRTDGHDDEMRVSWQGIGRWVSPASRNSLCWGQRTLSIAELSILCFVGGTIRPIYTIRAFILGILRGFSKKPPLFCYIFQQGGCFLL